MINLDNLDILHIKKHGKTYYGSDQEWYKRHIQRYSGCGPTVCANALIYLLSPENVLSDSPEERRWEDVLEFMDYIWEYVTPGKLGVNSTKMLKDGLIKYAEAESIDLKVDSLDISQDKDERVDFETVTTFLKRSLKEGRPVAFLNLSNGALTNLESWHWVLAVGLNEDKLTIYDQGQKKIIDLKKWLETSKRGGGFVSIGV